MGSWIRSQTAIRFEMEQGLKSNVYIHLSSPHPLLSFLPPFILAFFCHFFPFCLSCFQVLLFVSNSIPNLGSGTGRTHSDSSAINGETEPEKQGGVYIVTVLVGQPFAPAADSSSRSIHKRRRWPPSTPDSNLDKETSIRKGNQSPRQGNDDKANRTPLTPPGPREALPGLIKHESPLKTPFQG